MRRRPVQISAIAEEGSEKLVFDKPMHGSVKQSGTYCEHGDASNYACVLRRRQGVVGASNETLRRPLLGLRLLDKDNSFRRHLSCDSDFCRCTTRRRWLLSLSLFGFDGVENFGARTSGSPDAEWILSYSIGSTINTCMCTSYSVQIKPTGSCTIDASYCSTYIHSSAGLGWMGLGSVIRSYSALYGVQKVQLSVTPVS